jgi:hypothetical protein
LFALLDIAQQCMVHFEKRHGDVPMTLRVSRATLLVASYHGLKRRELGALADFEVAGGHSLSGNAPFTKDQLFS